MNTGMVESCTFGDVIAGRINLSDSYNAPGKYRQI